MTAEVAVMNKLAVALAADSAVTFTTPGSQKIYNAANKLFALSKHHPVGVMVYGNAEFMGIPWETIIKIYRQQRGERALQTLKAYFEDVLDFLDTNDTLFDNDAQQLYVKSQVAGYFFFVRKQFLRQIEDAISATGGVTQEAVEKIMTEFLADQKGSWAGYDFAAGLDAQHQDTLATLYGDLIREGIQKVFEKLPLLPSQKDDLLFLATCILCKNIFSASSMGGIVIAGFGESEHFPSLYGAVVAGRAANRLKYKQDQVAVIEKDMEAVIIPFAQSDVVNLFIEGIDPAYDEVINGYLDETFKAFPEKIVPTVKNLSVDDRAKFVETWQQIGVELLDDLRKRSKDYIEERFVQPMMNIVGALPKDDLASLAEALVNLTSLKRKVSMTAETVGGPVDVAVISKGDGLIWMRRKHYFRPDLNHQFFANYFGKPTPSEELTDDSKRE